LNVLSPALLTSVTLSGAVVQRAQALDELLAVNWGDRTMEG